MQKILSGSGIVGSSATAAGHDPAACSAFLQLIEGAMRQQRLQGWKFQPRRHR
jgi:hypothetical protein